MHLRHNEYIYLPNHSPQSVPGVAMVFSCNKNDEILVPGLLESFFFCDFFIVYYDDGTDFNYDESKRHKALIEAAKAHNAKWVYLSQPTIRLSPGWRNLMIRWLAVERPIIIHSPVYYFWDYSLDTIRTDLTKTRPASFFRIHPQNSFSTNKLHHIAAPLAGTRIRVPLARYNLNRLGPEVCLAKADYYQRKDGDAHNSLRDFSHLTTKKINPISIRGLGSNELNYIKQIKTSFCDQSYKVQGI